MAALLGFFFTLLSGFAHPAPHAFGVPSYDRTWQITSLAREANLNHQRVFDIDFETNGVVWLATTDGLRRFDGYSWSRFDTNNGLPSSFIRAVRVTRSGDLWVGSDAGAGVFDVRRGVYESRGSERGLASRNVRQIVEDPDGSLWFSCDQWPITSQGKGGLTCFRDGQWTTFDSADGLPVDYVVGYFRNSRGRQFAFTPRGWVERRERRWELPAERAMHQEKSVLHMAEASDGTLLAQGESQFLVLRNGAWGTHASETVLIATLRSGDVIGLCRDASRGTLWFSRWDGGHFDRASSSFIAAPEARLYRLREAPDGSVWAVGYDTVVRWSFRSEPWTFYPELPPPREVDARGRLWFASGSNIAVRVNDSFQPIRGVGQLVGFDPEGSAIGQGLGRTLPIISAANDPTHWEPIDCGIQNVTKTVTDAHGQQWLAGYDGSNAVVLASRKGLLWKTVPVPQLKGRRLNDLQADPRNGLWMVTHPPESIEYELVHVTEDQVTLETFSPARPPLMYPRLSVGSGHIWLHGYSGLYRRPLDSAGPWEPVTAFAETGFADFQACRKEVVFHFTGGPGARSGCAVYDQGNWQVRYGPFYRMLGNDSQNWCAFGSRGGLYLRRESGTLDFDLLPAPSDEFITSAAPDTDGSLWIGTSDGVLHYRPGTTPPETSVKASVTEVPTGGKWPVQFAARNRFGAAVAPDAFQYSWRVDAGAWTLFGLAPNGSLQMPQLSPGEHRLELRARDWDGNIDPTPAVLAFTQLPIPLQQRGWFPFLVGSITCVIAGLSWLGVARTRQIAQSNSALRDENITRRRAEAALEEARSELERRVVARTAELSEANTCLSREIAERQHAEDTQRKLEEQLRHAQKMEAIGTLAGGIAHDFNNILGIIIPYTHLAIDATGEPEVQRSLQQILIASDRARNLVQQILAFSRQQRQERRLVDLAMLVKETLKLMRSALPSTVEFAVQIEPGPHVVMADATQIHQVLTNLCVNAEHAMRGRQGRLQVSLKRVRREEPAAVGTQAELPAGEYARLTVRDNGCGMTAEVCRRIFEPFFTTKGPGEGTGLGLAVVHGIVKDHQGVVCVQSEPGMGTEFEIHLPLQQAAPLAEMPVRPRAPRGAGQHVLLVDDEPAVVGVVRQALERVGYRVTLHTNPRAALAEFCAAPDAFDLVLTDLTMPGLTGVELARDMRKLRPELPIVLATGFGGQLSDTAGIARVLNKPFDPVTLATALHDVLQESASQKALTN